MTYDSPLMMVDLLFKPIDTICAGCQNLFILPDRNADKSGCGELRRRKNVILKIIRLLQVQNTGWIRCMRLTETVNTMGFQSWPGLTRPESTLKFCFGTSSGFLMTAFRLASTKLDLCLLQYEEIWWNFDSACFQMDFFTLLLKEYYELMITAC